VSIKAEVKAPTATVVMHALELEVQSAKVAGGEAAATSWDEDTQMLTLTFPSELPAGATTFELAFTGEINDKMAGFYRSKIPAKEGEEQEYVFSTQFEATDARRAFPCWDEPCFKATFDVAFTLPGEGAGKWTVLSNMPVKGDAAEGAGRVVSFDTTPVMSTYLLAWVIAELESVSGTTKAGTAVNVYTTKGKKEKGRFALDMGVSALEFFAEYFAEPYPLPKMDMIGIPEFAAGAMENWGCVTYRETALLIDEASSAANRERVAYVVSHELAHQWFGNLVTMYYWEGLVLNEGFATWAGWLAVDNRYPEWQVWESFLSTETARAMVTDGMASSHAIELPIDDPKQIDQIFDALSYQKGASIIRMIETYLGSEVFRKGMVRYLAAHKYANATTADLAKALSEESGVDVNSIMESWMRHVGFPVVSVEGEYPHTLTQHRFLSSGKPTEEQDTHVWHIPTTVACGRIGEPPVPVEKAQGQVLTTRSTEAALASVAKEDLSGDGRYFKLNVAQAGFFRVLYSKEQMDALSAAVAGGSLSPEDRLGLVADAFALSKAGLLDPTQLLDLYAKYKEEDRLAVWTQVMADFGEISTLLENTSYADAVNAFKRDLYAAAFARLGWDPVDGEPHTHGLLRGMLLKALSGAGDKTVSAEALARFPALIEDPSSVHPNLFDVIINIAVQEGGAKEYESVKKLYLDNKGDAAMRTKCLLAMGRAKDEAIIAEFCDWSLNSGNVQPGELLYPFASMSANRHARRAAWATVKANWSAIREKLSATIALLGYMVSIPLRGFCAEADAADAEAFFTENPVPEASMALSQVLETIRSRHGWLARDGAAYEAYFTSSA
jgi:aminopeptidase N